MRSLPFIRLISTLSLSLALAVPTISRADVFKTGFALPDVDLLAEETGKPINLQKLKGKKTVLFIFASW